MYIKQIELLCKTYKQFLNEPHTIFKYQTAQTRFSSRLDVGVSTGSINFCRRNRSKKEAIRRQHMETYTHLQDAKYLSCSQRIKPVYQCMCWDDMCRTDSNFSGVLNL